MQFIKKTVTVLQKKKKTMEGIDINSLLSATLFFL